MRLLSLVALATVVAALPPLHGGRRKDGFTSHLFKNRESDEVLLSLDDVGKGTSIQLQDHFDEGNKITWEQKYYWNELYTSEDSNVNILYLSGEQVAGLSMIVGIDQAAVYYASLFNATLFALEHRFYGDSHPTEDTSIENLKFLSSRQAIEDIAEFIRQKNALKKSADQKWIVVGGSYAGALASWARLKHPELIAGAIASSGPVLAQMDFYGYFQTVDEDFKKIGGQCYDTIRDGLEEARQLFLSPEGRDNLTEMFQITPPLSSFELTDNDRDTFYDFLLTPFAYAAQYSLPSPKGLCQFLTRGTEYSPLEALQRAANMFYYGDMDIRFSEGIKELSGTGYDSDQISMRLWIYQTCAEFGYFQTTNKGDNVFGATQSSNSYIEYCVQLFGINADEIQRNIDSTNAYYGERDYYAGTNVVFSHGTQDPWSFLTKKSDAKHWSVVMVEVEGGSHCEDIGVSCFTTPEACTDNMKQIQQLTLENIKRWIDPVFSVPDKIEITDNVGKRPQLYDPVVTQAQSSTKKLRSERSLQNSLPKNIVHQNRFAGKSRRMRLTEMQLDADTSDTLGTDYFEQTWDHFNVNEERTFKQRFFYNTKFGSANGPNFLMIGGEGPEDISWVQSEKVAWMTFAQEVGANAYILEHRYYGDSKLGTNDLQYLSSAQMLYDVATFIRSMQMKEMRRGPWITFGGSYPGSLSAWAREWFPELIFGAVGSSGPVLAKNDFYEYLEVVEDVIKRHSQECYDRTTDAFSHLRTLTLSPEGRKNVSDQFKFFPGFTDNASDVVSEWDLNEVFMSLYGMYQGTVQYNTVDWSSVKAICDIMVDEQYDDSLEALAALKVHKYGDYYLLNSFELDINYYQGLKDFVDGHDPTQYTDFELAEILWLWQTCTEFGYYQTTDYGDSIFGTPVTLNSFAITCERLFGLDIDTVQAGIARSNYQYGGRTRYNSTNVVLPNGDADPWHALGILDQGQMDPSVVPILIPGTSHCADMNAATAKDPPALTAARKTILENIKKWLAGPEVWSSSAAPTSSPMTSPSTTTVKSSTITTTVSSTTMTTTTSASAALGFLTLVILLAVRLSL